MTKKATMLALVLLASPGWARGPERPDATEVGRGQCCPGAAEFSVAADLFGVHAIYHPIAGKVVLSTPAGRAAAEKTYEKCVRTGFTK